MPQTATAQKQNFQHTVVNLTDAFQIAAFYAPMQQACPLALKERSQADFEAHLDAGHAVFGVLDDAGAIVGMNMVWVGNAADVDPEKRSACSVDVSLSTRIAFVEACAVEAKGQGVGSALLKAAISYAAEQKATKAYARVESQQTASMGMFNRAGFVERTLPVTETHATGALRRMHRFVLDF